MKLEDYLPLAEKLAYRNYSEDELNSVITFLKVADRRDAEAFLDEYARIVSSLPADPAFVSALPLSLPQLRPRVASGALRDPLPSKRHTKRPANFPQAMRYAAVLVALVGVTYFWINNLHDDVTPSAEIISTPIDYGNQIPPAGNRATLTLSNGEVIALDSVSDGKLADQYGTSIVKEADRIIYQSGESGNRAVTFNTMSTPRGGQYTLTLSDGTRIWLNAASSITYPTQFNGNERVVQVSGEVYFEVASRTEQPFIVNAGADRITVLGTTFNVRAYVEDGVVKTSLVEGLVRINDKVLLPGQAYINGDVIATSVEQDIAWRMGYFNFNGTDLQTVMREIARWYDVQVVYPEGVPAIEFGGEMQRNLDLVQILKALEKSNVRFRIESNPVSGVRTIAVLN